MDNKYRDLQRTYNRNESIVFCKTKESYGGLSNMAAGYEINVGKYTFKTSEALYQACRYPHNIEIQREIMQQNSPMTAKMKSKKYRKLTREDWEEVRVPIMRWCVRMKLINNWEKFGNLLRATANKDIVEESSKDDFWGAYVMDASTLKGANVLGRLLVETRKNYYNLDYDGVEFLVQPPQIENFKVLGEDVYDVVYKVIKNKGHKSQEQIKLY